jgi:murein DD-endopeptidase MepM/ murein hydrolase activator NlpD
MSHFSQNPVRSRKKNSSIFSSLHNIKPEKPHKHHILTGKKPHHAEKDYCEHEIPPKRPGFTIPLPSVATLAVIAGTVLIALTALRWEDLNIKTPERYAFVPVTESTGERTITYATTGIPGAVSSEQLAVSSEQGAGSRERIAVSSEQGAVSSEQLAISNEKKVESRETGAESNSKILVTFEWQQYRVQRGDAVSTIAKKFGVSTGAIIASNDIKNARRLQEGAVLRIPSVDGIPYTVKSGDSLSRISASFNTPLDVILDVNDLKSDVIKAGETIFIPGARMNDMDLRMSLGELFIYPVHGRYITSKFGMRKDPISGNLSFHTGIDIRAGTGAPVMAAMDGTVSVTSENWVYGKYVIISHPNGFKTLYAHLSAISVKQGDRVTQGRKIGEAGNTGYSTGSHLHFSVYDRNNKLINPLDLLH